MGDPPINVAFNVFHTRWPWIACTEMYTRKTADTPQQLEIHICKIDTCVFSNDCKDTLCETISIGNYQLSFLERLYNSRLYDLSAEILPDEIQIISSADTLACPNGRGRQIKSNTLSQAQVSTNASIMLATYILTFRLP